MTASVLGAPQTRPAGADARRASPSSAPGRIAADDGGRRARAVVRHARWVAATAAAGIAAHLAMALDGGWMAFLALAMAAGCAPCAWTMWRRPSVHAARVLVGMSLAMALAHAALVLGLAGVTGGHAHGGGSHTALSSEQAGHDGQALAIVAADLASALLAAGWLRRAGEGGADAERA
ncbi:hypothetical protein SPF06_15585 [Sinomonas sp. JGH33]|uniref:Uncharacterized protein n=1 Tax=Sinomonas terricola TaxID=3110330 RepID=A0ABU5T916_9MICC|nr:hypothetical protein [Sinomonas sp. JGH33]MEA5456157.1 hypothetical protein [Sinomonas sp. JGH33]